ncbi:MAG: cold shock domain-containing protein [Rhodobacteraceae bacterium]|nr:cold shock domain-containing protein [Paracoccaceae bacterium]
MSATRVTGSVKWFDTEKGFGFILCESLESDVLLHANVLRSFGQSSVADGSGIALIVQESARGWQAVEVLEITPPASSEDAPDIAAPEAEPLDIVPARVKWFDKLRGFGFANVFGDPEDVFVHANVLRAAGLADLAPGEAVGLKILRGARGASAAAVVPWDIIARTAGSGTSGKGEASEGDEG